ncbi:MAG: AAA family ATPase [Alphaproteobacteria bacterium]
MRIVAVSTDPDFQTLLQQTGLELGTAVELLSGGFSALAAGYAGEQAGIFVVDIDGVTDPGNQVVTLLKKIPAGGRVVVVASTNDINMYRRFITAGVEEYLLKPLSSTTLSNVIRTMAGPKSGGQTIRKHVIVVMGMRGGIGTTTLAVNLAWMLANSFGLNTVLLDLDLRFSTAGLALDTETGPGLREALERPDQLDDLLLGSTLVRVNEHLQLLSAEENLDQPFGFSEVGVSNLLRRLKDRFEVVVMEMPRHLAGTHRNVLAEAEKLLMVLDLSLVSIRDYGRLKNIIGKDSHLVPVIGRFPPLKPGQFPLPLEAMEKSLQTRIPFQIPEDYKLVAEAANQGKPLAQLSPNAPVTIVIRDIARSLLGIEEQKPPEKKLFPNLFSKPSK